MTDSSKWSASFLVRFWREPRPAEDGKPVVRGLVRNLHTGEEHYVADPAQLGEDLRRLVRAELGLNEKESEKLGVGAES